MSRIQMKSPLVEVPKDETAKDLWERIKEQLILPYVELKTECVEQAAGEPLEINAPADLDVLAAIRRCGIGIAGGSGFAGSPCVIVSAGGMLVQRSLRCVVDRRNNAGDGTAAAAESFLAWIDALRCHGEKNELADLIRWCCRMEAAVMTVLNEESSFDFYKDVRSVYANLTDTEVNATDAEPDETSLYEAFLDERSYKKKREILRQMGNVLTDKMITDFAVSLDVVVEDGPFETRYLSLLSCLDQMCRFESEGLR